MGGKIGIANFYNLFLLILDDNEGVVLYQTLLKGILGELIIKNLLSRLSRQYWPCVLVIWQKAGKIQDCRFLQSFFAHIKIQ